MIDDNRITIPKMFEFLSPTAKVTYNKDVIFIVPQEKGLKRHLNKFLKDNPDAVVIDQTKKPYTYAEQRNFVADVVCQNPSNKIIVLTHSAIVLSDAFACQIYIWRHDEDLNEKRFKYIGGIATFGASPERIALHAFRVPESIGSLSDRQMHEWLGKDWNQGNIGELRDICHGIGGGWPRAKLQEILNKLEDEAKNIVP